MTMRILVTGSDYMKVADIAKHVPDFLEVDSYRITSTTDNFPNIPACSDVNAQLASAIGMTSADLATACYVEQQVHFGKHLLLCHNMPLLSAYGEQMEFPYAMHSKNVDSIVWDTCRHLLRNLYSSIHFDYVFRVGSLPTNDMLAYYGMAHPIEVSKSREVADVLEMEVKLWTSQE